MHKLPTSLANRAGNQCSSLDESPSFIEVSFQSKKIQKEACLSRFRMGENLIYSIVT